jgi:hypothetical protein
MAAGCVVAGWPDLARFFSNDGVRCQRVQIWELGVLGRRPGRCGIADDFILSFVTSVNFGSVQSFYAMGCFQLMVLYFFFDGGDGRRRGRQQQVDHEDSRGLLVFSLFSRGLCDV